MGRGKRQCNGLAQTVKNLPAMQETWGSIPGSGRSSGEGNVNPLQYSYLENSKDRGAWWATVHGAARMTERLTHTHIHTRLQVYIYAN